jgi:hypothetical protein
VHNEWAHLCGLALGNSRFTTELLIFYGDGMRVHQGQGITTNGHLLGEETRGDVSAHGFWKSAPCTIFDVQITDTDAKSYGDCNSAKLLEQFAQQKRNKYDAACLE